MRRVKRFSTFLCVEFIAAAPVEANALLDSLLKNATSHDFVAYFDFAENKTLARPDGLVVHNYYSKVWTCSLVLSVDKNGRVVHMRLGVPRPLIDDAQISTRGRDIVKSFLLASALGDDVEKMQALADEIYIRGLDLQPISISTKAAEKSSGHKMHAYKVGKGPLSNGDNAIFLAKLPDLSAKPSSAFDCFAGKIPSASLFFKNCRLSFSNDNMTAARGSIRILWCETWDEAYSKMHAGQKSEAK
jgi:hypothetical protein